MTVADAALDRAAEIIAAALGLTKVEREQFAAEPLGLAEPLEVLLGGVGGVPQPGLRFRQALPRGDDLRMRLDHLGGHGVLRPEQVQHRQPILAPPLVHEQTHFVLECDPRRVPVLDGRAIVGVEAALVVRSASQNEQRQGQRELSHPKKLAPAVGCASRTPPDGSLSSEGSERLGS